MRFLVPLVAVFGLFGLLAVGLSLNPREVPSPLIGKPAPAFSLTQLENPEQVLTEAVLLDNVTLVNVWATWCVACRAEHDVLLALHEAGVPIIGLNYKDERPAALQWLVERGNPYVLSLFDPDGLAGIDWGVYGVPETFIVDKAGIIRYKHIGPITIESVREQILPMIKQIKTTAVGQ